MFPKRLKGEFYFNSSRMSCLYYPITLPLLFSLQSMSADPPTSERASKRLRMDCPLASHSDSTFLGLPLQLRIQIYRILLVNPRPIGVPSGCRVDGDDFGWDQPFRYMYKKTKLPLSKALNTLLVCRQICAEASAILYHENTFAFKILESSGKGLAFFLKKGGVCDNLYEAKAAGVPIQKMERFVIKVEVLSNWYFPQQSSVRSVTRVLSQNFRLSQLDIYLEDDQPSVSKSVIRVLEPFKYLRNVEHVNFVGVPPVYANYLTIIMTKSPQALTGLMRSYFDIQRIMKPGSYAEEELQKACEMVERNHVLRFRSHTSVIRQLLEEKQVNADRRVWKWIKVWIKQEEQEKAMKEGKLEAIEYATTGTSDSEPEEIEAESSEGSQKVIKMLRDVGSIESAEKTQEWIEKLVVEGMDEGKHFEVEHTSDNETGGKVEMEVDGVM